MMYEGKTVEERIDEIVEFQKNGEIMEFFLPATEEQMNTFEKEYDISIPESYKKWLRFSNGGYLFGGGGPCLYGVYNKPDVANVGKDVSKGLVPKEYLILGYWESKHICYNRVIEKFFFYEYEEPVQYFNDFCGILAYIIDICTN